MGDIMGVANLIVGMLPDAAAMELAKSLADRFNADADADADADAEREAA